VIGPDGTLYGFQNILAGATAETRLLALGPAGRSRWSIPVHDGGGEPVLSPDSSVRFISPAPCPGATVPIAHLETPGCLVAVGGDGRLRWQAMTQGLTKGMPHLLVRPDGAVVRATVGPGGLPLTVYAPNGVPHPLGATCGWAATALGTDDQLYAVTYGRTGFAHTCTAYGAPEGQTGSTVVALTDRGTAAWVTPLPVDCAAVAVIVDPRRGHRLYVATSCQRHGEPAHTVVTALDTQGQVRWTAAGTGGGAFPALALDRASGDVWLADDHGVQRITPTGVVRWQRTWPSSSGLRVSLVLDAHDTAYTCGGDGLLHTLSGSGAVLWQYRFVAPRGRPDDFQYTPPSAMLGPDGELYVSSDGEAGMVVFTP